MTTTTPTQDPPRSGSGSAVRALWRQWVVVNALGELVGLGLAGALAAAAVVTYEPDRPTVGLVGGRASTVANAAGRVAGAGPELAAGIAAHAQLHTRARLDTRDVAHGDVAVVVLHDHAATAGAPTAPAMRRDRP